VFIPQSDRLNDCGMCRVWLRLPKGDRYRLRADTDLFGDGGSVASGQLDFQGGQINFFHCVSYDGEQT